MSPPSSFSRHEHTQFRIRTSRGSRSNPTCRSKGQIPNFLRIWRRGSLPRQPVTAALGGDRRRRTFTQSGTRAEEVNRRPGPRTTSSSSLLYRRRPGRPRALARGEGGDGSSAAIPPPGLGRFLAASHGVLGGCASVLRKKASH